MAFLACCSSQKHVLPQQILKPTLRSLRYLHRPTTPEHRLLGLGIWAIAPPKPPGEGGESEMQDDEQGEDLAFVDLQEQGEQGSRSVSRRNRNSKKRNSRSMRSRNISVNSVNVYHHPLLRSNSSCLRLLDKQSVLVAVRVRPLNPKERAAAGGSLHSYDGHLQVTDFEEDDPDLAGNEERLHCVTVNSGTSVTVTDGVPVEGGVGGHGELFSLPPIGLSKSAPNSRANTSRPGNHPPSHPGSRAGTRQGKRKRKEFSFDSVFHSQSSQQEVFDRTAALILQKVLLGFNGCVFAYGQTGSGKTFTMMGSKELPGVIPQMSHAMFDAISKRSTHKVRVWASFVEIYNERLHDLLVRTGAHQPPPRDLKIVQDNSPGGKGIYIDGLSEMLVESTDELLDLLEDGQTRRAVGRTNMNEHSSRSHAVLSLRVESTQVGDMDGFTTTSSKLHMIDLAGSERAKSTGAQGSRLKEGSMINLSLSALGNVINALTSPAPRRAKGGNAKNHIPYRDSKLTRLLEDSLGGNAYTVMICNVSPAPMNSEETIGSLRFAERAKKIENKAVVNRDPKAAKLAAMMEENAALRLKVGRLEAYIASVEENYVP